MWNFEEWKVFCKETSSGEILPGCFGTGGDVTYLSWMVSAWGWTLSVALLALPSVSAAQSAIIVMPI